MAGYFHIDIAELRTGEGKLHMFVAIDRTPKFAFVKLEERATSMTARAFLEALIEAVPYRIHTPRSYRYWRTKPFKTLNLLSPLKFRQR